MYTELSDNQQKKLTANIKISSILIQFTYLAFPLSMYIVYNKIIANNNPSAIMVVVLFLLTIIFIQLILKTTETIHKNILKANTLIKEHKDYLFKKLNTESQPRFHEFNTSDLAIINKKSSEKIQADITSNYLIFLIIYFVMILIVGRFIAIVPAVFLGINYIFAKALTQKHDAAIEKYNKNINQKTRFVKEMFAKHKEIKGLNITKDIIKEYDRITLATNINKCSAIYYKNFLLKISIIINMLNIAFILILGRLLHNYDLISMQEIIACSLLTVWISRSIGQVFVSLSASKSHQENRSMLTEGIHYSDTKHIAGQLREKPQHITSKQFQQIQKHLKDHPIVYWKQTTNVGLYSLKKMYTDSYVNISYIDSNFKLFYGSILDNLTLFNHSRYDQARKIISDFQIDNLINNLPYQLNYVTTGTNDEAIPYDLMLTIIIVRELLKKPDLIILDINSDEISIKIRRALINYIKNNHIKLILKQNSFNDRLNVQAQENYAKQ